MSELSGYVMQLDSALGGSGYASPQQVLHKAGVLRLRLEEFAPHGATENLITPSDVRKHLAEMQQRMPISCSLCCVVIGARPQRWYHRALEWIGMRCLTLARLTVIDREEG